MNTDLKKWNPFKFLRRTRDASTVSDPPSNAAPKKWPPEWSDLSRLFSRDPLQAMSEFFQEPRTGFSDIDRWFGDFSSSRFQPRVDVVDDGAVLRVTAELPGMDRGDLQTSIEDGTLVLRGEKKQDMRSEENGCYRLERSHGYFMRRIPLPEDVGVDQAEAKFDKGVLTLTFPKTASSQATIRKIEIN